MQNIDLQKAIVESLISKNLASPVREHDRHLDSKLIGIVKDDLVFPPREPRDMKIENRTTHRQLRDMSEKEFKLRFHRHIGRRDGSGFWRGRGADENITLASSQEQEQQAPCAGRV